MSGEYSLTVKMPEKIFVSISPADYSVDNYFRITVTLEKTSINTAEKTSGESYPSIYIKGFELLFADSDSLKSTKSDVLEQFFAGFSSTDDEWAIRYDKFPNGGNCAVISCSSIDLPDSIIVDFYREKCEFTLIPENEDNVEMKAYAEGFNADENCDTLEELGTIYIHREFAVYIESFNAYKDNSSEPVSVIHKGEKCIISWKINPNERASAFLYDDSGNMVKNLPDYSTVIDRDKRFKLVAYNDYCTVIRYLNVYRTLWQKKDEQVTGLPNFTDKGTHKIYKSYGGKFYLYIHPNLYISSDCLKWDTVAKNNEAPQNYKFYSSAFSEYCFVVCYLTDNGVIYNQYDRFDKCWKRSITIKGADADLAYIVPKSTISTIITKEDNCAVIYDCSYGELENPQFISLDINSKLVDIDVLTDYSSVYIALLFDNGRAYYYDLNNDSRNNIFECTDNSGRNIILIKSNTIYLGANGNMFDVYDREKFSDLHFFPQYKDETVPIMGKFDDETVACIVEGQNGKEFWKYKF